MKVEILGSGCIRCDRLYENTMSAASEMDVSKAIEVTKVGDIKYFRKMGVFTTPALLIEGEVISVGKVLTVEEIRKTLGEKM